MIVLVRGGGDLGTGVAHSLAKAGHQVCVVDLPRPTALRLTVAFARAALEGRAEVEGVVAVHESSKGDVRAALDAGQVALWTGSEVDLDLRPDAVVDARMRGLAGTEPPTRLTDAPLVIGVGPGFVAGESCHLVVESNRGARLGAVIRSGSAETHTGIPGLVGGQRHARLLTAPSAGVFTRRLALGDFVEVGEVVGDVAGAPVTARLEGMIRGLKLSGTRVGSGHKVGDIDPRRDRALLAQMTDKARGVGAGVLRALEGSD